MVDNITIDGTEIDLSSGDLTLDVAGDIILDADGADIIFADGGTQFGFIGNSSSDMVMKSQVQDKDLIFKGNDGGSTITALTLDMSDAGTAIFNHDVKLGDNGKAVFGSGDDLQIYHDGSNSIIADQGTGTLNLKGSAAIYVQAYGTDEYMAAFSKDGPVQLYYDNAVKFGTTSTGIDVTGPVVADGFQTDTTSPNTCLLYTSPSPRDGLLSRMPSSA